MIFIILVSHGPVASAMIKSAAMIAGKINNVAAVELDETTSVEEFKNRIAAMFRTVGEKEECIVLSDFMVGTPFNVLCELSQTIGFHHLTGMNMPLFLTLLARMGDAVNADELIDIALAEAQKQLIDVNKLIEGLKNENCNGEG